MNYHYSCVIDADGHFKELVLVVDGAVQHYTLGEGDALVAAAMPDMRGHAGDGGFVSPVWDVSTGRWTESASAAEIAAWEAENPAPVVIEVPSQLDMIEAQVTYTALMTDTLLSYEEE